MMTSHFFMNAVCKGKPSKFKSKLVLQGCMATEAGKWLERIDKIKVFEDNPKMPPDYLKKDAYS